MPEAHTARLLHSRHAAPLENLNPFEAIDEQDGNSEAAPCPAAETRSATAREVDVWREQDGGVSQEQDGTDAHTGETGSGQCAKIGQDYQPEGSEESQLGCFQ